jgi:hypothetical protein
MEHVFQTDHAGKVRLVEVSICPDGRGPDDPTDCYAVVSCVSGETLMQAWSLENALHWIGVMPTTGAGCEADSFKG